MVCAGVSWPLRHALYGVDTALTEGAELVRLSTCPSSPHLAI